MYVDLKVCLGVRCCIYIYVCIGVPQYTTLVFGFPFLWVLAGIWKNTMQLCLIDMTPLLQLGTFTITLP